MADREDALPWFEIRGHKRKKWKWFCSSNETLADEFNDYPIRGLTLTETSEVLISAEDSERVQAETCLHELCHVALNDAGLDRDIEEHFVSLISPRLWPLLKQLGFKWPKKPRGYKALRRSLGKE